jgi:hypothetical protein
MVSRRRRCLHVRRQPLMLSILRPGELVPGAAALVRCLAFGGIRTSLLYEAQTAAAAVLQHNAMEAMQAPEAVKMVTTQPPMVALALR